MYNSKFFSLFFLITIFSVSIFASQTNEAKRIVLEVIEFGDENIKVKARLAYLQGRTPGSVVPNVEGEKTCYGGAHTPTTCSTRYFDELTLDNGDYISSKYSTISGSDQRHVELVVITNKKSVLENTKTKKLVSIPQLNLIGIESFEYVNSSKSAVIRYYCLTEGQCFVEYVNPLGIGSHL